MTDGNLWHENALIFYFFCKLNKTYKYISLEQHWQRSQLEEWVNSSLSVAKTPTENRIESNLNNLDVQPFRDCDTLLHLRSRQEM